VCEQGNSPEGIHLSRWAVVNGQPPPPHHGEEPDRFVDVIQRGLPDNAMPFSRTSIRLQLAAASCLLLSLATELPAAAQSALRPGWGFNWRLRERASCRIIDSTVLPNCSNCREMPNAYQSGINAQACFMVPKFEYVIFPSEDDCRAGLERMKRGNAP
jgi:hypothetical protein